MSPLELLAALLSALGVWLTAQRFLLCWPTSALAAMLYAWVFWSAHLYADMALQGVFIAFLLYGWWHWAADVRVSVVSPPWRILALGLLAGAMGATVWGMGLARFTDDPAPFFDASLSSYSIVGQFWMARRYRLSWALWIIVDTLYVGLFVERALLLTAILYGAFVGLAVVGWRAWGRR